MLQTSNKMLELVAADKMRRHSSKQCCGHLFYKNSHSFSRTFAMNVLLVFICALVNNHVSAYGNHHFNDDIISPQTKNTMSLVLPHDTYPGFSIKKFSTVPVTNTNNTQDPEKPNPLNYRLLETGFSKYFTVLEDGMVMTTSDLSPLVNRPVNLIVVEETPNSTATHQLQLYVMNRNDMLRFPGASLDVAGEVKENQPKGTQVRGIPLLQANSAHNLNSIKYSIIDGNIDDAFALQQSGTKTIQTSLVVRSGSSAGVWLVTNKPLDKETRSFYDISVQASDEDELDKAISRISITVLDENDNRPIFTNSDYKFTVAGTKALDLNGNYSTTWQRFTSIGKVEAKDADGDKVAYKLITPSNTVIIVPQTGQLMLASEPEKTELLLEIEAHDLRIPSLSSAKPAKVLIEFVAPDPVPIIMQYLDHDLINQHSHRRDKRRVTRAVRPTKRIEFTEADGDAEGKSVFQLEKETDRETFKIRDENPWVTVEPNGAVRVKKKWDYEELGPEKTIDFWVIITNAGHNGNVACSHHYLFTIHKTTRNEVNMFR